uniref:Uncharacterized protein n=1 Tax=Mycena chlorophos TaxID=658473 RepID=A0ABQ0L2V4_MYCCL|nr:predicted protein [Mycena chlorophos]
MHVVELLDEENRTQTPDLPSPRSPSTNAGSPMSSPVMQPQRPGLDKRSQDPRPDRANGDGVGRRLRFRDDEQERELEGESRRPIG